MLESFPPALMLAFLIVSVGGQSSVRCAREGSTVLNLTYKPSTVLSNVSLMVPRAEGYVVQR